MIVFGEEGFKSTENCVQLVSGSLGAFINAEGSEVVVDEPMYIFPLADIFFRAGIGSAYGFLAETATSVLLSPPLHNSIHLSFLTLLLLALKGGRRLSELFLTNDFDSLPCAYTPCKLVRLTRGESDGNLRVTPFLTGFPETDCDERWATESPDWLQHAALEPFCSAKLFSHADLLFVVQLQDGSLLPIALKIILKNAQIHVSTAEVEDHLSRLTYERIFEVFLYPERYDVDAELFAELRSSRRSEEHIRLRCTRSCKRFGRATDATSICDVPGHDLHQSATRQLLAAHCSPQPQSPARGRS